MTNAPTPWRVSTSDEACRFESASRMTVRLTPNSAISAASVASLPPGASRPSRIRSDNALDDAECEAARAAAFEDGVPHR